MDVYAENNWRWLDMHTGHDSNLFAESVQKRKWWHLFYDAQHFHKSTISYKNSLACPAGGRSLSAGREGLVQI